MKKKIKVLHVLHLVGGVEICFRQICENIDESIIETSIVCQKLVNKPKLVASNGKEIIPFSIPIVREINPVSLLKPQKVAVTSEALKQIEEWING